MQRITRLTRVLPVAQILLSVILIWVAVTPAQLAAQEGMSACPPAGSATELTGAGATFPAPLYTRWFQEYASMCGVQVNYQAIGSGGGITQHTQRTVQFGASDGIMTDAQKGAAPGTVAIPMVAGAVVPVVNLPGFAPGTLRFTPEMLAGIYLGEITRWNDPRITSVNTDLSLPDLDIIVVRRADGSGTTNIFTSYLAAVSDIWRQRVGAGNSVSWPAGLGGEGNAGVAGQVRQLPGAIGYVELAYATQNNLSFGIMLNRSGVFVGPSLDSTTAAMEGVEIPANTEVMLVDSANPAAWPIAGFTWILVYQDQSNPAVAQTLAYMLWWATHDAQGFATALEYAPLSPAAQRAAEVQILRITNGGAPIIP
jgi:phosphate transport system substrate-binding protein